MKIAVPMTGDYLDPHFGHCEKFALIDIEAETKKTFSIAVEPAPAHEHGLLPRWLKERGVTHVIAGGMGAHARSLLAALEIEVITGAPADRPAEVIAGYLAGSLESVDRTCDHVCQH
jgi:ATP-binding protein involved in chromosome partitioning